MQLLAFYISVILCSTFAQESHHYEIHQRFKRQINQNHPKSLENENRFNIFLPQRNVPLHINTEQLSEYIGAAQHGTQGIQVPFPTDQPRNIIHFPQQQTQENMGKDPFELTKAQTEKHNSQTNQFSQNHLTELYVNGIKVNEPINVGDLKLAPNKRNTFQIHNIVHPITKVTRTVYINGVKIENDQNVGRIIHALLNQHTSSSSPREDSNGELLNVNQNSDYNQQIPSFIVDHLNNNHKLVSNTGLRENLNKNNNSNYFMQTPDIDIRMGGLEQNFGNSKLAKLREKGRNLKNATSIPKKNQHMHVKPKDLVHNVKHRSLNDQIIFL